MADFRAAMEAVLDGVGVQSRTGGAEDVPASMSKRSSARPSSSCRGSPLSKVHIFVDGRAVGGGGGCASPERVTGGSWEVVLRNWFSSVPAAAGEAAASSTAA
jgi:hypothetical protein